MAANLRELARASMDEPASLFLGLPEEGVAEFGLLKSELEKSPFPSLLRKGSLIGFGDASDISAKGF